MGKRQDIKKRREQKVKQQQRIVLIVVVAIVVVIAGIVISQSLKPVVEIKALEVRNHPTTDGLTMGDPNAPVRVEEFSDFQCVACSQWWSRSEQEFIDRYVATGDVLFVYQPFSFIGVESLQAAEAAYCANEQGEFWKYHDMLFSNWTGENVGNFNDDRLVAFAGSIGLNEKDLKACLNSNKYKVEVEQGLVYGNQNGVEGTPSFLVNGKLVGSGELFQTIDSFLGQ